ncbi:MAG: hypothetical protein ACJ8AT_02635 [Hyalangium sp.]
MDGCCHGRDALEDPAHGAGSGAAQGAEKTDKASRKAAMAKRVRAVVKR